MKTVILAMQSVRELALKATLLILTGISTILLLVVVFGTGSEHTPDGTSIVFFGVQKSAPMPDDALLVTVRGLEASMAGGLFAGIIFFGVLATAGLLPDTLEKGIVDIYLSKPITRGSLLAGRTLGAATAIFINIVYFLFGVWLAIGFRIGVWDARFLVVPLAMVFAFLALYSVTTLFGALTRSTVIAIIVTFLFQFVLVSLLENRESILFPLGSSPVYRGLVDSLYYIFPQTSAIQQAIARFIVGEPLAWKPFATCAASTAVWYTGAWWILERSEF